MKSFHDWQWVVEIVEGARDGTNFCIAVFDTEEQASTFAKEPACVAHAGFNSIRVVQGSTIIAERRERGWVDPHQPRPDMSDACPRCHEVEVGWPCPRCGAVQ